MRMDRKGIMSLPIKMTVAFLILSIFIPVLTGMIGDLEENNDNESVTTEAKKISDAMSKTYYAGIGGNCTVNVTIDYNCHITLGGEDSKAYSIGIFVLDKEVNRLYLERPSVKIIGDGLDVSGNRTLLIECVKLNGLYGVEVSILD